MRKQLVIFLLILSAVGFISCEEDFSPIGDYREEYVMNSILRGDTNYHVVTIEKNYFGDGYDPYANEEDPVITNAYVRIWESLDDGYEMSDTIISKTNVLRYDSTKYVYYIDNLSIKPDREMYIEALLETGERLTASTKTPELIEYNSESDNLIPPEGRESVSISWIAQEGDIFYLPNIYLTYFKKEGNNNVKHRKRVPSRFVEYNGDQIPFYPKASSQPGVSITMEVLDQMMRDLSAGDTVKSNYQVQIPLEVEVVVLDKSLTSFYKISNNNLDSFSIRLDESDYSNVNGGLGVFGSYMIYNFSAKFTEDYIESFGYIPVF